MTWQLQAACAGTDPEMWFPEPGEDGAQAKAFCARCPVRETCLQTALDTKISDGIWGGLSAHERTPSGWDAYTRRLSSNRAARLTAITEALQDTDNPEVIAARVGVSTATLESWLYLQRTPEASALVRAIDWTRVRTARKQRKATA